VSEATSVFVITGCDESREEEVVGVYSTLADAQAFVEAKTGALSDPDYPYKWYYTRDMAYCYSIEEAPLNPPVPEPVAPDPRIVQLWGVGFVYDFFGNNAVRLETVHAYPSEALKAVPTGSSYKTFHTFHEFSAFQEGGIEVDPRPEYVIWPMTAKSEG